MQTNAATPAQRELAEVLGVDLPLDASVGEASELINLAPASNKQHLQASELDLGFPPQITYSEAKRQLALAYPRAGKRIVIQRKFKVGDVLLKDGVLWEIKRIFSGFRLSVKPVEAQKDGRKVKLVPTGAAGKVFNAFTFRDAVKIDPQALVL